MSTAKTEDGAAKDKAAGKHIPDAPNGAPGSSRNPSDPEAPNYAFEPQGVNSDLDRTDVDQGSGVQKPTPVFASADDDDEDGAIWIDEQVALGRRIAVSTPGDGSSITYEEIVPSNATNTQVAAAKDRLRKRLVAD